MSTGKVFGLIMMSMVFAGGQLLFKLSANRIVFDQGWGALVASFISPALVSAVALYGVATVLWVILLTDLPLSRAYPFVMLSFLFVPVLSWFCFGDTLSPVYFVGLFLMMAGAAVIVLS
jgi:drug/metabolite transporter (DMT)-like permease